MKTPKKILSVICPIMVIGATLLTFPVIIFVIFVSTIDLFPPLIQMFSISFYTGAVITITLKNCGQTFRLK